MTALVRRSIGCATAAILAAGVIAPATAATASQHTGREYFLITVANNHEAVVAHGAFTGAGSDDASHENYDVLHLGGGTLKINHPDSQSHFKFKVNHKSCFVEFTITGTYTLSAGTGRFAGVTGHGSYAVDEQGIAKRTSSGACNLDSEPTHLAGFIQASGPAYTA